MLPRAPVQSILGGGGFRDQHFFQCGFHFIHVKSARTTATLEGNARIGAYDIEAVRKPIKGAHDGVVDIIHQKRDGKLQSYRTRRSHFFSSQKRLGLFNLHMARGPAGISGMRLSNVDPIKISLLSKCFVRFLETPGLPRKGASRVRSKHHHGEAFYF